MKTGLISSITTPANLLAQLSCPILMTFGFACLEALVPKGRTCPQGYATIIPLNRKTATCPYWALNASELTGKDDSWGWLILSSKGKLGR